jgi:hypothetical protein
LLLHPSSILFSISLFVAPSILHSVFYMLVCCSIHPPFSFLYACLLLHPSSIQFSTCLFVCSNAEEGSSTFLWYVGKLLPEYTASNAEDSDLKICVSV